MRRVEVPESPVRVWELPQIMKDKIANRNKQKWIRNVMRIQKKTREEAEALYNKIYGELNSKHD